MDGWVRGRRGSESECSQSRGIIMLHHIAGQKKIESKFRKYAFRSPILSYLRIQTIPQSRISLFYHSLTSFLLTCLVSWSNLVAFSNSASLPPSLLLPTLFKWTNSRPNMVPFNSLRPANSHLYASPSSFILQYRTWSWSWLHRWLVVPFNNSNAMYS